jgi:hypothetical protein
VALDRRDDAIRDVHDLEQSTGVPVLAQLIDDTARDRPRATLAALQDMNGAEADAYRTLATKLWAPATGRGSRSILLIRPGGRDAGLAPLNLAATFATQGLRVALVGSRPSMHNAAVLLGETPLPGDRDPYHSVLERLISIRNVIGLHLLSLGEEVTLGALLRNPGFSGFDELMTLVDVIVLDGVNLHLASTTLTFGRLADAAIVLGEERRAKHTDLHVAVRELHQVGTSVLGSVLVRRPRRAILPLRGRRRSAPAVKWQQGPSRDSFSASRQRLGPQVASAERPNDEEQVPSAQAAAPPSRWMRESRESKPSSM